MRVAGRNRDALPSWGNTAGSTRGPVLESVAPGRDSALRMMDLGRPLKTPVLPVLEAAAFEAEGTAA